MKIMVVNEVASAIWVNTWSLIPIRPKVITNTGTMTKPPPIPNRPANKPAAEPTNRYTKNVMMNYYLLIANSKNEHIMAEAKINCCTILIDPQTKQPICV